MPRSPTQMVGSSGANISVSQTTAASACEARRLGLHVGFDVLAAGLLLAFEQELHVDRQFAGGLQQAFDGLDLDVDLALVVAGAAGVDVVAADLGLEGRRVPLVQRIGRLHVVVAVEEDRGLAGRAEPLGVDQRIALAFDQFGQVMPAARSSSRANSAARRMSGLCSESVLMLGMRRKVLGLPGSRLGARDSRSWRLPY